MVEPPRDFGASAARALLEANASPEAGKKADDAKALAQGTDPKFKTTGEKVHKWATYGAVDWVWNAASGIAFVYTIKYNKVGQKLWSPVDKAISAPLTKLIKNEQARAKSIELGNTFVGIIVGGLLTIPPLVVLEKNSVRKGFAKFYDRIIHGKDKVENDPEFQAAYARMDHEEHKDFKTGMYARALALAPLAASVLVPLKAGPKVKLKAGEEAVQQQFMQHHYFDPIAKVTDKALKRMDVDPVKIINKVSPHISRAEATERWTTYINKSAAPMEIGFDIPYAIMHAGWYNYLAKKQGKKDPDIEDKKQQTEKLLSGKDRPPEESAEQRVEGYAAKEAARRTEAEHTPPTVGV